MMNKLLKRCLILTMCIGFACGLIACGGAPDSANLSNSSSSSKESTSVEVSTESSEESSEKVEDSSSVAESPDSSSDSSSVGGVWTPPTVQP